MSQAKWIPVHRDEVYGMNSMSQADMDLLRALFRLKGTGVQSVYLKKAQLERVAALRERFFWISELRVSGEYAGIRLYEFED